MIWAELIGESAKEAIQLDDQHVDGMVAEGTDYVLRRLRSHGARGERGAMMQVV